MESAFCIVGTLHLFCLQELGDAPILGITLTRIEIGGSITAGAAAERVGSRATGQPVITLIAPQAIVVIASAEKIVPGRVTLA